MSNFTYQTNDPVGYGGDPSRGAALGRADVSDVDCSTYAGRLYLKHVRINQGGYDSNGTYFGIGQRLYWLHDSDGRIDRTFRAYDRDDAIDKAYALYPKAKGLGKPER